jgi:hypothetical protein
VHADDRAVGTCIAVPADHGASLYSDSGRDAWRQNVIAITPILLLEQLPTWHADYPGGNSLALERFMMTLYASRAALAFALLCGVAAALRNFIRHRLLGPEIR